MYINVSESSYVYACVYYLDGITVLGAAAATATTVTTTSVTHGTIGVLICI